MLEWRHFWIIVFCTLIACILNKQFVSVFTREEVTNIRKLHGPNYPDITDLGISTEGVEKFSVI